MVDIFSQLYAHRMGKQQAGLVNFSTWLSAGLSKHGKTNTELAKVLNVEQPRISEMRAGRRNPKAHELRAIAEYIGEPLPPEFVPDAFKIKPEFRKVRIVGYVGAGAEMHFYSDGDNPDEDAEAPPGATDSTVAVEIRGTSLGAMFDRALVFYDEKRDPPTSDMLRKLCVVQLSDGRVLVKQLLNGSIVGHFHLLSQTEGMIENITVEWAAVVKAIIPR
jgi:transcriptional regulator with XRE-family HTH domain